MKDNDNKWNIPKVHPVRSASTSSSVDRNFNKSADDLVLQGLNLVGTALKPRSKTLKYMKAHNFSTPALDSSMFEEPGQEAMDTAVRYSHKDDLPSSDYIESQFNELLNEHAFLGIAKQNLKSLSDRRKWELIRKEKMLDKHLEVPSSLNYNALQLILKNLSNRVSVAQTLYQLERFLRHTEFIATFLESNGIKTLAALCSCLDKNAQYVYLSCYKALLNDSVARSIVFQNKDWIFEVFEFLGSLSSDLRVRLLSTQIVILLTYSNEWSDLLLEKLES